MSDFACPSTEYVKGLTKVKEKMIKMASNVDSGDSKNIEGQAAKLYFENLFTRGFNRNHDNIFNACLDYGYTIIRGAIARSIAQYGYIPCLRNTS